MKKLLKIFSSSSEGLFSSLYSRINFTKLEKVLSYKIHNKDIFVQALLHRSYLPLVEIPAIQSNERLEFLGDAVLDMVVGEYVFQNNPDAEEGQLTIVRSQLVNRKALVYYAQQIGLPEFILSTINLAPKKEQKNDNVLADSYEALIAALYIDGGISAAKNFVLSQITAAIKSGFLYSTDHNFKSQLLEYTQSHGMGFPLYRIINEEGPHHDKTFTIEVVIQEIQYGIGKGKNKKEAEQYAAEQALIKLYQQNIQQVPTNFT